MNTADIMTIVLALIGSSGLFTLIQFLINRNDGKKQAMEDLKNAIVKLQTSVDKTNEDMGLQNEALMSLAQDRILWLGRQYLKQGWIFLSDYSSLKRMADAYRALGGNGDVKVMMAEIDKLPHKLKGEKNENIA